MEDVVRNLREARVEKLYSLRELAKVAGVSTATLFDAESGKRMPNFNTIRRIALALDIAPLDVEEFKAAIELRGKDAA